MTRALTIAGTEDSDTGIDLPKLIAALSRLPGKPWLRICMYKGVPPEAYLVILQTLKHLNYPILLQPCDSEDLASYSVKEYEALFTTVMKVLWPNFDMIECANEINGDWCGENAADKMNRALYQANFHGNRAVTLYLDNADQDQMWDWVQKNTFFAEYVFISNYPYSSKAKEQSLDPSLALLQLSGRFPYSKVGIGEYGTEDENGKQGAAIRKGTLMRAFETRKILTLKDGGFGFYWDFYDDCVKNQSKYPGTDERFLDHWKELWIRMIRSN